LKSKKQRDKLIKKLKTSEINSISEISKNCLLGNIPLKDCEFNKLKKFSKFLRLLAKKNISQKKKRRILIQKGGFLNILIPPVLSLLSNFLIKKFTDK
jgi:hypothetical protein